MYGVSDQTEYTDRVLNDAKMVSASLYFRKRTINGVYKGGGRSLSLPGQGKLTLPSEKSPASKRTSQTSARIGLMENTRPERFKGS